MSASEAPAGAVLNEAAGQWVKKRNFNKNRVARLSTRLTKLRKAISACYTEGMPGELVVIGRRADASDWCIDYVAGNNAAKPVVAESIRQYVQQALLGGHDGTWTVGKESILRAAGTNEDAYLQAVLDYAVEKGVLGHLTANAVIKMTKEKRAERKNYVIPCCARPALDVITVCLLPLPLAPVQLSEPRPARPSRKQSRLCCGTRSRPTSSPHRPPPRPLTPTAAAMRRVSVFYSILTICSSIVPPIAGAGADKLSHSCSGARAAAAAARRAPCARRLRSSLRRGRQWRYRVALQGSSRCC